VWTPHKLSDEVVSLRCISEADVGATYLGWLHDKEVIRFLEVRHAPPRTEEDIKSFVRSLIRNSVDLLMGIYLDDGDKHVGNIKLSVVSESSQRAEIGILIGDKSCWGRGVASRAIRLMTDYAVRHLGIRKISAGCYAPNIGSRKAFLKAGYLAEGVLKDHWVLDGRRVDELLFGYSAVADSGPAHKPESMSEMLVFIGGGELMLDAVEMAKRRGFGVCVMLAPRHAAEALADGRAMVEALTAAGVAHAVVASADEIVGHALLANPGRKMALCFGPAWVFPNAVLAEFDGGMFNYNGIPIPQYLGGAHFTWQILNGDRQSGSFIQRITADLDRGGIVCHRFQELPETVRVPADYFHWNREFGLAFLEDYFDLLASGISPAETSFESVAGRRLYFPRLNTYQNGWIDWDWTGEAILSFCNAFDTPYVGASTCYEGRRVHLRGARMISEGPVRRFHPYCSGLIVAGGHGDASVATSAGLLLVERIVCAESGEPIAVVQGRRFHTDSEQLQTARRFRPSY
jgi:RimJ/RimL family protein N-acetyltransferase/methionyl-tRNA formyltransferase